MGRGNRLSKCSVLGDIHLSVCRRPGSMSRPLCLPAPATSTACEGLSIPHLLGHHFGGGRCLVLIASHKTIDNTTFMRTKRLRPPATSDSRRESKCRLPARADIGLSGAFPHCSARRDRQRLGRLGTSLRAKQPPFQLQATNTWQAPRCTLQNETRS